MRRVLLIQLPVPQLNYGLKTGNIPFAAACLHQAAAHLSEVRVEILPQAAATCMGDAALLQLILNERPHVVGLTTYLWNARRVLWLAREIKRRYSPLIMLGGPEVTPDNHLLQEPAVDYRIFGEGEEELVRLLQTPDMHKRADAPPCSFAQTFASLPSPYLVAPLDPGIENTFLLETMRGCPYACAYCYYSKSRRRPAYKGRRPVFEALRWALERGVQEIYFLDPSFDARPGLKDLLKHIARINKERKAALISEIRADHIDTEMADLLAAAGFSEFEIGLQSTNPAALKQMNRSADLKRFVRGVRALKQRKIRTVIDLIVGLPGDDPTGFARSVQFVADNGMGEAIQVFPLAVLPGTEFRRRHRELGLNYQPLPPYTVTATPTFSQSHIREAFALAEERLAVALHPLPDLNIAWQIDGGAARGISEARDVAVVVHDRTLLCKVIVGNQRPTSDLAAAACRVTHPYQLLFPPGTWLRRCSQALSIFSAANPHTPLEAIFFNPARTPVAAELLQAIRLERPHYLDGHLRWLDDQPGNRAVIFTVVTEQVQKAFSGPLQRQIFWWRHPHLPDRKELDQLEALGFNGILIDTVSPAELLDLWQNRMALLYDDLILIGFARVDLHRRWLQKTAPDAYRLPLMA